MRVNPKEIVRTFKETGSVRETSRLTGASPATVSRWIKRARSNSANGRHLSTRGLKRKSTAPKKRSSSIKTEDLVEILKLRKTKGYCASKIKAKLDLKISHRTIHRALAKHGLLNTYGFHRRPRFQDTVHMHVKNVKQLGYLQMDVKYITPELSGLPWTCYEYAVIDIKSRYKEAVILNHLDQDGAILALREILPKLPFKTCFVQTDNGLEFQSRFLEALKALGLKHHYIHKRSPNENAVVERAFRTDEEEFFFRLPRRPKHYDELRELFANWLKEYNEERPHLGINLKTPAEVVSEVVSH